MPTLTRVAPLAARALVRLATKPRSGAAPATFPPPDRRAERALAAVAHRGFQISMVISLALLFGLLSLGLHARWFASLKIALGATLFVEGLLLATDWRGARRLTLWRFWRHRAGAAAGARTSIFGRLTGQLALLVLQLLGVIWVAAGLLAAVSGL